MDRLLATSVVLWVLIATPVGAQIAIVDPFDADYSFVDLGAVPGLPPAAGGLTFVPGNPNTLLIGGAANGLNADVFSIGVVRDANDHVTGFSGTATFVADAPGIGSGGIDGGLAFGPGGVLFYTSYNDNSLGQIKPGSAGPDLQIALGPLGVASSVGTLAFVPPGFPGAGRMKVAQYNSPGNWYDVVLGTADANGTYPIAAVTLEATIGFGPEGIIYVGDGNPQFDVPSVLVSEYGGGSVSAYEVDANGDPLPASRRPFMTGLSGAEGAAIDPLTGDFLFSTFGGGNRVVVVRGFVPPPSTTSTTSTTAPTTSTTLAPTTTTSSSTTSTSTTPTTAAPVPTTSTTSSTLPAGDCAVVPPGPTLASVVCRVRILRTSTEQADALGALQSKVLVPLGKAGERADEAVTLCAGNDPKKSRARLKQARRQLIQFSHRLRARSARKRVPEEVRGPLAAAGTAIADDVTALRTTLTCPGDAAAVP